MPRFGLPAGPRVAFGTPGKVRYPRGRLRPL